MSQLVVLPTLRSFRKNSSYAGNTNKQRTLYFGFFFFRWLAVFRHHLTYLGIFIKESPCVSFVCCSGVSAAETLRERLWKEEEKELLLSAGRDHWHVTAWSVFGPVNITVCTEFQRGIKLWIHCRLQTGRALLRDPSPSLSSGGFCSAPSPYPCPLSLQAENCNFKKKN